MDREYPEISKEKQEKILQIVSSSFYKELVKYGINSSDIVSVSMNLLDYATEKKDESGSIPKELPNFKISDVQDNWESKKELSLNGIKIVPLRKSHIEQMSKWLQNKELDATFIGYLPKTSKELTTYLFHTERTQYFAMYYQQENFVGVIGCERINHQFKKLEMKKLVGEKKYRGKGIGKSATFLLLYYAFNVLKFNKVYIHSIDTNIKNINLNSRFGFHLEGLLYKEVSVKGIFHDVIRMSMLKDRWEKFYKK